MNSIKILITFFLFSSLLFWITNIQYKLREYEHIQPLRFLNISTDYSLSTNRDKTLEEQWVDILVDKIPPACKDDQLSTECLIQLEQKDMATKNWMNHNKLPFTN